MFEHCNAVVAFPALADIPQEGHAILIAPQWLVTAAHAVSWQMHPVSELSLNGQALAIEKIAASNEGPSP